MSKNSKRGTRTVDLADFCEVEYSSQRAATASALTLRPQTRLTRPPPPRRIVDAQALRRAFMLQHFQFILRADLLSLKPLGDALPQGQRRLVECLRSSDSLVPWTAVHAVVMRAEPAEFECPICLDTPTAPRITECGHVYCMPCMLQYLHKRKLSEEPRTCPVCNSAVGLYMLRPVVLVPTQPLRAASATSTPLLSSRTAATAGESGAPLIRFDLFRRERDSCILHRYDDPRLTSSGRSVEYLRQCRPAHGGGGGLSALEEEVCLPTCDEPAAVHSRYLWSTPQFQANQRCMDGAGISERLHEVELRERPLTEFDAAEEHFLLEALNEVTREPQALAPSLVKSSPPLGPQPGGPGQGGARSGPAGAPFDRRGVGGGAGEVPSAVRVPATLAELQQARQQSVEEAAGAGVYEVYAEGNGQPYYLHMVCVKMLRHDARLRGGTPLPDTVMGRVLDTMTLTQTTETRRIYKVFAHVPLHGFIHLCLLDLQPPLVLPETVAAFRGQLDELARQRRERRRTEEAAAGAGVGEDSWRAYLRRHAPNSFADPEGSPWVGASDLSQGTAEDSAPFLQLPSAGETYDDHGLQPSTLETRQRATKRQDLGGPAAGGAGAGGGHVSDGEGRGSGAGSLVANLAALASSTASPQPPHHGRYTTATTTTATTSTATERSPNNSCWGGGSAAKLFGSGAGSGVGAGGISRNVGATWGGHAFQTVPDEPRVGGVAGGRGSSGAGAAPRERAHPQKRK